MSDWPKSRVFGGKRYKHFARHLLISEAKRDAKRLKGDGDLVRVTRGRDKGGAYYDVWHKAGR